MQAGSAQAAPPAARRPLGDRVSVSSADEHGGEEAWERISQSGQTAGSASEIGSLCGSVCGDEAALEGLVDDWALIGPIGEDGPAQWDHLAEYDVTSLSGRSTPSSSLNQSSLAERLCAGPFGGRALRRHQHKQVKKRLVRPLNAPVAAPAQGASQAATEVS